MIDGQNICDQITIEEGPNAHDQIAFCPFHSILHIRAMLSHYSFILKKSKLYVHWAIPENIHTIPRTALRISEGEGGFTIMEF